MRPADYPRTPAQAHCRLCQRLFAYFKATKARQYCEPCVEIERRAANVFYNGIAKQQRRNAA